MSNMQDRDRPGLGDDVAQLVGRLVHDIRNPLAAVISNLRYVEGETVNEDLLEAIGETIQSSEIMSRLLADAHDLFRLADRRFQPRLQAVALAEVARTVRSRVSHRVGSRLLKLSLPELDLNIDGDLLKRILSNVVEHSLKYTPTRQTVELVGHYADETLTVTITDGGPPFDAAVEPSIVSGVPATGEDVEGRRGDRGLGLLFAGHAVGALGGLVSVAERQDGAGLVFTLTFPCAFVSR